MREVSLVDRPANQAPFLIVKCEGGVPTESMEAEEMARTAVAASEATPAPAGDRTHKRGGVVIEIHDGIEKFDPLEFADEEDDEEAETAGDVSKTDDDADATEDTDDDADDSETDDDAQPVMKVAAVQFTSESLTRLMDVVNAISKADAIEDAHAAELRDIAKALDPEAITAEIAPEDARKVTTDALSKLMTTVNLVKALDDGIDVLPIAVVKSIGEIAASLNGAAATTIEKTDDEVTDPEPDQPQLVVYKSEREDGDLDLVIKRGSKMKTSRLSKLKEAHAMLTKLIDELDGESAASGGSKKTKKSEDDDATENTVDVEAIATQVTDSVKKTLVGAVKTINDTVNELNSKIEAVSKRMDDVDGVVPDGNAEDADEDETQETKKNDESSFKGVFGIPG